MTTYSAASPSRPHLRQPRSSFRPRRAPAGPWSACGLAQPVVARMPRPGPFTQPPPARAVAAVTDLTRHRKCSHAPIPRSSRLAAGATWGRSMFVELDTRHDDGLAVTLEWD